MHLCFRTAGLRQTPLSLSIPHGTLLYYLPLFCTEWQLYVWYKCGMMIMNVRKGEYPDEACFYCESGIRESGRQPLSCAAAVDAAAGAVWIMLWS